MSELHGNIGPTRNYENLTNLPSINDVKVVGNLTPSDLGLADDASVEEIRSDLENKVDKATGKGLSENDYTDGEKAKLEGIEAGAEKNVQSDWDASDGSDAFIKNKPAVLETVTIRGTATTKSGTNTDLDVYKTAEVDSAIDTLDNKIDTNVADLDERKAEIDGYYETFTSGQTEQLIATEAITDTEPYIYRKTGGSNDVGDRVYDTLVGGSVVWNQLSRPVASQFTDKGLTVTPNADGSVTVNGTSTDSGVLSGFQNISVTAGHKYLLRITGKDAEVGKLTIYTTIGGSISITQSIRESSSTGSATVTLRTANGITYTDSKVWVNTIDLTAALGSTIADYAYSLETATAGAGVAWVRKYFSKEYYAYAEPHFEHVQTSAKETVGFNQWDEEWENGGIDANGNNVTAPGRLRSKNHIPAFPETVYFMHIDSSIYPATWYGLFFYDGNKHFISTTTSSADRTFTTPVGTRYIRFHLNDYWSGKAYTSGICINIHGDRDGEYEPYRKRTYPLDSSLTLRGIPKLDAANKLYFDGDTYESDGTVTRRYGVVDLGTLTWTTGTDSQGQYFKAILTGAKSSASSSEIPNIFCVKYVTSPSNAVGEKNIAISSGSTATLYVRDTTYNDAASFKTAMSGVYLLYELNTPEPFTAEPFQSPMVVDPLGTEEFVDYGVEQGDRDVAIPVGINSSYPQDLRGKLQHLPSLSTSGDGRYVVVQTGNQMTLSPDTSLGLIAALEARVAALEGGN